MSKKAKLPTDVNARAKAIVDFATSEEELPAEDRTSHAARGRQGGLKGGRSRAEKLTKTERSEIARKAAEARWASKRI